MPQFCKFCLRQRKTGFFALRSTRNVNKNKKINNLRKYVLRSMRKAKLYLESLFFTLQFSFNFGFVANVAEISFILQKKSKIVDSNINLWPFYVTSFIYTHACTHTYLEYVLGNCIRVFNFLGFVFYTNSSVYCSKSWHRQYSRLVRIKKRR